MTSLALGAGLPIPDAAAPGIALRHLLTTFALPPVALLLICLGGGLLAWRGSRVAALGAALAATLLLLLATPAVAGLLRWSLERELALAPTTNPPPRAIIVLGAEVSHGVGGASVGPLTLERLRAGAALHRRTGLPLLVTGGVLSAGDPPLASLMARSLAEDFGTPPRWVEAAAADTRGNAALSAAILAAEGIGSAYVVSHAWHLPRALDAFARLDFATSAAPVSVSRTSIGAATDWLPRADHLADSAFALREWAGRVVYALRD